MVVGDSGIAASLIKLCLFWVTNFLLNFLDFCSAALYFINKYNITGVFVILGEPFRPGLKTVHQFSCGARDE
jgi:hypothetical protein